MKKSLLLFASVIFIFSIGYYFSIQPDVITVKLYKVSKGEVKSTVSNTRVGTVKACRRAFLAPSIGGNVANLFVKEGDQVKHQQILLAVWNDDLKAQLKLHKAQIKHNQALSKQQCELAAGAKREAIRLQRLSRTHNLVSDDQVDKAVTHSRAMHASCQASKLSIDIAQATLLQTEASIERTIVRAPFDGTIAEINAELGEFVTPSPPGIATLPPIDLLDMSCLTISAPIDEVDAYQLKTGMTACVTLDAFDKPRCSGTVTRIAPYVLEKEKQARTVEVEIKLNDKKDLADLLPGYSADIEVLLASKAQALRVPTEAVLENNQVLLVSKEGFLESRQFKPGLANWSFIEVVSGLTEKDTIVLSVGQEGIKAGASVREEQ